MGTISEYQRQNLASEAVGTPGADRSGVIIGKAAEEFSSALVQRQQALDKIQYTNAYYDYVQQDEINRVKLQRQYSLEPEKYQEAYSAMSAELTQAKREELPERQRSKFDLLISRRNASVLPSNLSWVYGQQNKLALDRVEEGGTVLSLNAQSWVSGEQYVQGLSEYRKRFSEVDAPLLDPAYAQTAQKKYIANATIMYASAMLDTNNGGALKLKMDLESNDAFRKEVLEAVGPQKFSQIQKQAENGVKRLMSEQTYDMVKSFSFDPGAMEKLNLLLNAPAGLALAQAEQDVMTTENALEQLRNDPNSELYGAQISVLQEQLKQQTAMAEIARNRDDMDVVPDYGAYSDLQSKILQTVSGISTPKERAALASDVAGDVNRGGSLLDLVQFAATGTTDSAGNAGNRTIKANTEYSAYLQNLYKAKGEVLAERLAGRISNKQADHLLTKILEPLSTLGQYDRLQGGDNVFVSAYQAFDEYAKSAAIQAPGGSSPREVAAMRDTIRARMMSHFSEQMAVQRKAMQSVGDSEYEPSAVASSNLIGSTIETFSRALTPKKFQGIKAGDPVTIGGKPVTFKGYDRSTGAMIFDTPASLDKSLENS